MELSLPRTRFFLDINGKISKCDYSHCNTVEKFFEHAEDDELGVGQQIMVCNVSGSVNRVCISRGGGAKFEELISAIKESGSRGQDGAVCLVEIHLENRGR